ncbi:MULTISPECIES: hypothetical protein [Bacillus]|uniref:Uncharacterized protein n=1 Tax=Bacillus paranthracis TaxID=2026186 RepID=A0A9X8SM37_9BACI|nr:MULTISPECIES: hypothetical protein [Bacillus cereus group]ONG79351.1 hypothetical protein BKK41_20570 [Bacillus cereus]MCH5438463.1 hypothetical protein [Bacillus paranthracis]MDA1986270.1 hypothetical protein [Bacillus cereus group sp. BcHK104]MDX6044483.1 hypothetical protein [Bacillus paranthracis]SME36443.1 hypothetical protein BACERE00221_04216 [Bacillus paranthracis]
MSKPVGFDQKVLLHHLDFTANHTKKYSRKDMYEVLDGYLRNDITGAKSRKNAVTMLMKIWYLVDKDLIEIRDRVLEVLPVLTKEERVFIHWGMTLAAYPFFKDAIHELGKLFQLQDTVPSTVIGKRMKEEYGDRRRVEVATSAVLMSIKAWGIIIPTKNRSYQLPDKVFISNPLLQVFIVKIMLHVLEHTALQIDILKNHPMLFPFDHEFDLLELRQNEWLTLHHQGVDTLIVECKKS